MARILVAALLLVACDGGERANNEAVNGLPNQAGTQGQVQAGTAAPQATGGTAAAPEAGSVAGSGAQTTGGIGAMAGTSPGIGGMTAGTGAGAGAEDAGMASAGTTAMAGTGAAPAGPVDGDPGAPMVEVPGVPCGAPNITFGGAPAANMVQIGGRDVLVAYPCAHEGARVTFYLALHGTLDPPLKIPFTMTSFPIHAKVDSDNLIVVAPQAIGTQWGRSDDGKDLPHLYEVIDWVYATFGERFDIRSMWASGGSWGAFYLSTFACDPMLEGRLKGVRMVVGGGCPRCSDRLACIVAQQELELGGGSPLSDAEKEMRVQAANIESYAMAHGCDARTGPMNLGPVRAWTWPNCDSGFAHSYYLGPGEHADSWADPTSLDYMVAEIKSIEQ